MDRTVLMPKEETCSLPADGLDFMTTSRGTEDALKRWELENDVSFQEEGEDGLYRYDAAEQAAVLERKPWTTDPQYYKVRREPVSHEIDDDVEATHLTMVKYDANSKHVRISALSLLKMSMHCRSGGNIEVMGLMQGKVVGDTFIVIDSFALPVEGTETRVNAQSEAYEYMVEFMQSQKDSGIDVSTQMLNQTYQEPFLAIVIDPIRTAAAGKVEIGAFRTYPQGVRPPGASTSEYQTIPLNKIEDFGVHAQEYYTLDISFFKSSLDSHLLRLLWNKYWIKDLADKLEQVDSQMGRPSRMSTGIGSEQRRDEKSLEKVVHDSKNVAGEHLSGQLTQLIKHLIFNHRPKCCKGH